MIISRGAGLLRNVMSSVTARKSIGKVVPSRHSHGTFHYRDVPPGPKSDVIMAECLGGFMWWWIMWHMWHDFGHVVGEFDYPDPSLWTDEELGIPPDD